MPYDFGDLVLVPFPALLCALRGCGDHQIRTTASPRGPVNTGGNRPSLSLGHASARIERTVARVMNSVIGCKGDSTKPRDR